MIVRSIVLRLTLLLGIGLLVGLLAGGDLASAADQRGYFARVPAEAVPGLLDLNLEPVFEMDYGAYRWLELTQVDYARLAASPLRFTPQLQAGQVHVPGYQFDPQLNGQPQIPEALQAEQTSAPGFQLVQFAGPLQSGWLVALKAEGLLPLQYYPHNTYLVWGSAIHLQTLAQELDFVRWQGSFHPGYKLSENLLTRSGRISQVEVLILDDGHLQATLTTLHGLGATLIQVIPAQPDRAFYQAIVELDAAALQTVAQMPTVLWLGYLDPQPRLDDELSAQITVGNYANGIPFPGYQDALAHLGYDGRGVIWSIIDTGVDYDHPDLDIVGGWNYPGTPPGDGPGDDCEFGGHGTHVAGIFGGNASASFQDGDGFLYGLGVAPGAGIFAQNPICGDIWPPAGGWQELSKRAVLGGAIGGNNSWTSGEGANHGYQLTERIHDLIVRDANFDTPQQAEALIEVFSAGNSGATGLTAPKEAKNLIVVANSLSYRAGDIELISNTSSRGPAVDGRWVPTLAAPGTQIASSRNDLGGICATAIPGTANLYAFCSGTSMAAPHVSGALALVTEWWRDTQAGANPSPAMAKALLVNAAVDMGNADIPNINEGWGRLDVSSVISPALATTYFDQSFSFDNPGETWLLAVQAVDPSQPLKISLAWTDAAGAVGANPALVNDLDLIVQQEAVVYYGNHFSAGWSVPGGQPDALNNLENVFLSEPGTATWVITVQASNLAGDGVPFQGDTTDQDFALVCSNCQSRPDYKLRVSPLTQTICAPSTAEYWIEIDSILDYRQPISLTLMQAPVGALVDFTTNPVIPPGSSLLTLSGWSGAVPGDYDLLVRGMAPTNTHTITLGLELFTLLPATVNLTSPSHAALAQPLAPEFNWGLVEQGVTYTLELAADPFFTQLVYTHTGSTAQVQLPFDLDFEMQYFWRVQAQNVCGSGGVSPAWSFTTKPMPRLLLVDDDNNWPDLRAAYTNTLFAAGVDFLVWDTQGADLEPQLADLEPFDVILWYSGAAYGGTAGPAAATEPVLSAWLAEGRCLVLSSQDYLYDRGLTRFANQQLGVAAYLEDRGQSYLRGIAPIAGAWPNLALDYPFPDYADVLTPTLQAELLWLGNQGPAGLLRASPESKTVFLGFPLEAIPDLTNRATVLANLLAWCEQPVGGIAGVVQDANTQAGIAQALVQAESDFESYAATTDAFGVYTLTLPAGVYTLTAQATGYFSQIFSALEIITGTQTIQDFSLDFHAYPDFTLTPLAQTHAGMPGETVTHIFTIQNTGSIPDRYTWITYAYQWTTTPTGQTQLLAPGESETLHVQVILPESLTLAAPLPEHDTFTLTATSDNHSGILRHSLGTTYVGPQPAVEISGPLLMVGDPGEILTHTLTLTNTGNYSDTFTLVLAGADWPTAAPLQTAALAPGQTTTFTVQVTLPINAPPIRDRFTMRAISAWDDRARADYAGESKLDLNPKITMFPSTQYRYGVPGQVVVHTVRFTNNGDTADSYQFQLSGNRWPTYIQAQVGPLAPGEQVTVEVPVSIPSAPWVDQPGLLADSFTVRINSVLDPELVKYSYGITYLTLTPAAALAPASAGWQIEPGISATGVITLTNLGDYPDRFYLSISGHQWPVELIRTHSVRLQPGEDWPVEISLRLPEFETLALPTDSMTLTAFSGWNAGPVAQAVIHLSVAVEAGIDVELPSPVAAAVGSFLQYSIPITNTGNFRDAFTITLDTAWPALITPASTGWLDAGATGVLTLSLGIPSTATDQETNLIVLNFQSANTGLVETRYFSVTALWHKLFLPEVFR